MKTNVMIVGAGPVGLTMAGELARYGLSVRIVDKNAARTDKSKALVVWPRTLELMDRMGHWTESFVSAGLRVEGATIHSGSEQIAHIDLTHLDSPHKFVLKIPQSETERLLEEHLGILGVEVERQVELIQFQATAYGVSCTLVHSDGRQEAVEADWLIGCDGAHNTVRHQLGMEFQGSTLLNNWILADVHLDGIAAPPEINIYWHSEGVLAVFQSASLLGRECTGISLKELIHLPAFTHLASSLFSTVFAAAFPDPIRRQLLGHAAFTAFHRYYSAGRLLTERHSPLR